MATHIVKTYKDDFGNKAIIEQIKILPCKGAKTKVNGYKLSLIAEYDNDTLYHISIHEVFESAKSRMYDFSCRTWKEI